MAYKKEKEILKDLNCEELEVEKEIVRGRDDKKMDETIKNEMYKKRCKIRRAEK